MWARLYLRYDMRIKNTSKYEIHYVFDIPNTVLGVINVLLNRKNNKAYIVMFGNPKNLPKYPTEIAERIEDRTKENDDK